MTQNVCLVGPHCTVLLLVSRPPRKTRKLDVNDDDDDIEDHLGEWL